MSEQISNGTAFNIYYSSYNIPYNDPNIKIEGAKYGMIVCKDKSSYNLLFVNGEGYPYLLSDDVNKFTYVAPIILNNISDGKEREIKLNYDNTTLLTNSYGQLMVNSDNYASKEAETEISNLNTDITLLQSENKLLRSQINALTTAFNRLNIDKDTFKTAYLDIWIESYQDDLESQDNAQDNNQDNTQDNKLCIRIKDNEEDIKHIYDLPCSSYLTINLYPTHSCSEFDNHKLDNTCYFVKQITYYNTDPRSYINYKNHAYVSIKNAYLVEDDKKYRYTYTYTYTNNSGESYSGESEYLFFTKFNNAKKGTLGSEDLGNIREWYTFDLSGDVIDINQCDGIDLEYFYNDGMYILADYPFNYNKDKKTFDSYQYYPVSKFSINTIDNFNIFNESPTGLKIICSYLNSKNELEFEHYDIPNDNDNEILLNNRIIRLNTIQIYPIYNTYYGINSNLKLYSQNVDNNLTIEDVKFETSQNMYISYNNTYTLNFDNVSYLEFKFSEESYYNKINFTLSNLCLSTTNNKNENTKRFDFSINKSYFIIPTTTTTWNPTTSTTTSSTTPQPL